MKKKVYLGILIIAVISFGFYYYFSLYPKQFKNDIYQQKGYEVHEVEEFTIRFKLDKKWLDIPEGKTKVFNEVLNKKFNSTVYLEGVRNNSGRYDLNFNIKHDLNGKYGKFLSHYKITNDSGEVSFTSKRDIINLYDRNEQLIKLTRGSRGSGPGESFSSSFNLSLLELVKEIELSLYLYEYDKL